MKANKIARLLAVSFLFVLSLVSCAKKKPAEVLDYGNSANPEIVSACTYGEISIESPILVEFVSELGPPECAGKKAPGFSISPSVPGSFVWIDAKTVTFKPSGALDRGTLYRISCSVQKLAGDAYSAESDFYFDFSVRRQSYRLVTDGFSYEEGAAVDELAFTGMVETNDVEDAAAVEKSLRVKHGSKSLTVEWDHTAGMQHRFAVRGIKKTKEAQDPLVLTLAKAAGDPGEAESVTQEIPLKVAFSVSAITAIESPERMVQIEFSAPLRSDQDFRGFVTTDPERALRFSAAGNKLKVYSSNDWPDQIEVRVFPGLKDSFGEATLAEANASLSFLAVPPQLRFIGNGVIVPGKDGVTVPIETVNLSGVIVTIEKIYADKMDQFLQVNELTGGEELYRTGKQIWKKIVPVPYDPAKRNRWIRTAIDLSPLVKDDDHNLYRITLSCDIRMSEYPGADIGEEDLLRHDLERLDLSEPSSYVRVLGDDFWERYAATRDQNRYDDYFYSYDDLGAERPNHARYFGTYDYYYGSSSDVRDTRNFLVSNLGMIAKRDANELLTVAVSGLMDTQPVKDALVSVFDYQHQLVASAKTDGSGFARLQSTGDAYMVMAESGKDRGYLKLQGASNLPVSQFDAGGQQVQRGVKGFIYGERGVWRPGDDIHLTFVLQDKYGTLPADHPVVLRFYDPQGRLKDTVRNAIPVGSFYQYALKTGPDDVTGTYMARIDIGGLSFSKEIPVETVKPNRLKITFELPGNPAELDAEPSSAKVSAAWLHGAIADGLKADVSVRFASIPTSFKEYGAYAFDDPVRTFASDGKSLFDGTLDGKGDATVTLDLSPDSIAPGKLMAYFKTRVYETGGNANTDSFSIPFNPYPSYVGVSVPDMKNTYDYLDTTKSHKVKMVLVDSKGTPRKSGKLEIMVYRLGWRWWWSRDEENVADFLGTNEYQLVASGVAAVKNGEAEWDFKLENGDDVYGRHLIRVRDAESGHTTGKIVYMCYPGWFYDGGEGDTQSANMLSFSADRQKYSVGETAKISIPSADAGRILLSVENNGKLISSEWLEAKPGTVTYDLKLTAEMTPNVYVHASLIQPYGQTINDRPIRLFGILPILVEDPATRLAPKIASAESFEPNSKVKVSVSEEKGRPMTYTLAIVDEGLLNITRFATPNPWNGFFKKDALSVNTYDLYGFVAAAYGGDLERLLAVGGGDDGSGGETQKANRFPPMVSFLGPFALDKGKTASHEIDIPQYVGAVRVMVVAGNDSAYGCAEKTVTVKKPVMTYATLPRVASVGETLKLPVTVFALEDGIRDVTVTVKASGQLRSSGATKQVVSFKASGDQLVTFDLTADGKPGFAEVEIVATSGKIESRQKIEMNVRVPSSLATEVDAVALPKGKTVAHTVSFVGLPGTNETALEISRIEPIDLDRHLSWLIQYPYGCVEQTTSSVFPQLYLDKISDLDETRLAAVRRNVQAGINRLRLFQTSSGGLSYWPGDGDPSLYGTVYAAHFLFEASAAGYVVPADWKAALVKYLRNAANDQRFEEEHSEVVAAYALFDIALAGEPDLGAMNRLREHSSLEAPALYKLAAAYALAGQRDEARRLIGDSVPSIKGYRELGGTWGSDLRDRAILAEGLVISGMMDQALPLINDISKALSRDYWYSTQTASYSLLAVGRYLSVWGETNAAKIGVSWDWNGTKGTLESTKPIARVTLPYASDDKSRTLSITNTSDGPLFARVVRKGLPSPERQVAKESGLRLSVSWYDRDGEPLDVGTLAQGTDIIAEIRVRNTTDLYLPNCALDAIIPAGWEITNPRFEGWGDEGSDDGEYYDDYYDDRDDTGFDYQDIRDDRVYTFFGIHSGSDKVFRLMLSATYQGKFYLPSFKVAAMYDESICGTTSGRWVSVEE